MAGGKANGEEGENILYDFLQPAEWTQDSEPPVQAPSKGFPWALASSALDASLALWSLASSQFRWPSHTTTLKRVVAQKLPWKLAISPDGLLLAILQEKHVEIRKCLSRDDDISVLVARFDVHVDSHPHWRRLCWDPTSSLLACCFSSGEVCVYNRSGHSVADLHQHVLAGGMEGPGRVECAVSGVAFAPCTADASGLVQILVTTYGGQLYNYLIRSPQEWTLQYHFDFTEHSIELLSSMVYSPSRNLLLLAVCCQTKSPISSTESSAGAMVQATVQAWRLVDTKPFCSRSVVSGDLGSTPTSRDVLTSMRRIRLFAGSEGTTVDKAVITHMAMSPGGQLLATVDCGGQLQLREVPSLRVTRTYAYADQFPEDPKHLSQPSFVVKKKKKEFATILGVFSDISWWSDEAVILACDRGDVVVASFQSRENLHNRLGAAEVLEPFPALAGVGGASGFYALECERQLVPQTSRRSTNTRDRETRDDTTEGASDSVDGTATNTSIGDDDEDDDDDDDEDAPLLQRLTRRTTAASKQVMYYLTENDSFRTEPKAQKVQRNTYRLFSLQQRTPEELFYRQIHSGEYGEALRLAQCYGLDKDIVYQSQWNSQAVSPHTIQDYLAKIGKHSWVLSECVSRIPDRFDTMLDLLNYGLLRTNSSAVLQLATVAVSAAADEDDEAMEVDHFGNAILPTPAEQQQREERRSDGRARKLRFATLNEEQQLMVRSRMKLLQYKDRLISYEAILGAERVNDHYSVEFFRSFRDANLVQSALNFAQAAEWKSVDALFCRHGDTTLPHRLAILSSFPETMDPKEYKYLLPEISGQGEVVEFVGDDQRDSDWSEAILERPSAADDGQFVYNDTPDLAEFRGTLTSPVLTHWYKKRAVEIESLSGLVENSLKLISMAIERHVKGLEHLHADLLTLETLVYECGHDVSLVALLKMPLSKQLELILSRAQADDSAMFVRDIRCWAMPLLRHAEKKKKGAGGADLLGDYLLLRAKDDLRLPLAVFEASVGSKPIIADKGDLVRIALECIYECGSEDQLSLADAIVHCLPSTASSTANNHKKLLEQVDRLEKHLEAAELICGYGVGVSVRSIRDVQNNEFEAQQMLTKLARHVARKSCMEYSYFRTLLNDVLSLQGGVFSCVKEANCYQIVASALLASGIQQHLQLADALISGSDQPTVSTIRPASATGIGGGGRTPSGGSPGVSSLHRRSSSLQPIAYRIPFDMSVTLVVEAAREYFNCAASLEDSDMKMARECLALIKVEADAVKSELNLINAVEALSEFSVAILPLQVRLHADRVSLVKSCIVATPTAYKKCDELLLLGRYLTSGCVEVASDAYSPLHAGHTEHTEQAGVILMWIAEQSLEVDDVGFAAETLYKLMDVGHAPAWTLCRTLGQQEKAGDLSSRRCLLSFAITHCPSDAIEELLRGIHLLDTELLYAAATGQNTSSIQGATDAVQSAVVRSADVVQSVMQSTGVSSAVQGSASVVMGSASVVMGSASALGGYVSLGAGTVTQMVAGGGGSVTDSLVGNSAGVVMDQCHGWMQTASSYWPASLSRAAHPQQLDSSSSVHPDDAAAADGGADVMGVRCHPFYTNVFPALAVCDEWFSYCSLNLPAPTSLTYQITLKQSLLRTCKIAEESNQAPVDEEEVTEVLTRLAEDCLLTDTTLAMAYLLSLPKVESANALFDRLPSCLLTYQLAIFYYCLHIYASAAAAQQRRERQQQRADTSQKDNATAGAAISSGGGGDAPKTKKSGKSRKQAPASAASTAATASAGAAMELLSKPYDGPPGKVVRWVLQRDAMFSSLATRAGGTLAEANAMTATAKTTSLLEGIEDDVAALWSSLQVYRDRLADFVQAGILRELDSGIDVTRFTNDAGYKRAAILSLARRMDSMSFDTALSMSKRYDLGGWPVYMEHLIFLFNDAKLSWSDVHARCFGAKPGAARDGSAASAAAASSTSSSTAMTSSSGSGDTGTASTCTTAGVNIVEQLLKEPQMFADRLCVDVFPKLDGCDHSLLLLYYDILQMCVSQGADDEQPITAAQHSKSLKKLKAAVPGLDYRQLVYGTSPLDAIRPVVISSNVHVIAKVVAKLPVADGFLSSSRVFTAFCIKLFWEGDGKKKGVESTTGWVQRYELAQEYSPKLVADDLLRFCQSMLYSAEACERVPLDGRQEICRRCAKLCRQLARPQPGQLKKRASTVTSAAAAEAESGGTSYEDAAQYLQRCLAHLETLQSDVVEQLKQLDDDETSSSLYHRDYATTPCDPDKVVELCTSMLVEGCSVALVDDVLKLANTVHPHSTQLSRLVRDVIDDTCLHISSEDGATVADGLSRLTKLVVAVSQHIESGHSSVKSGDVIEQLRSLCARSDIQMSVRRAVLQLLQQSFHLSDEDESLLLFCNTAAIVKQFFEVEVESDGVSDDASRLALFSRLLSLSDSTLSRLDGIAELLSVWPALCDSDGKSAWTVLFLEMISVSRHGDVDKPGVEPVLERRRAATSCQQQSLQDDVIVVEALISAAVVVSAVKYCILSGHDQLRDRAVQLLQQHDKVEIAPDDTSLSELISASQLTSAVASTPFYATHVRHLRLVQTRQQHRNASTSSGGSGGSGLEEHTDGDGEHEVPSDGEAIAEELCAAERPAEAGSMLMTMRDTASALTTFDGSFSFVSRWWQPAEK